MTWFWPFASSVWYHDMGVNEAILKKYLLLWCDLQLRIAVDTFSCKVTESICQDAGLEFPFVLGSILLCRHECIHHDLVIFRNVHTFFSDVLVDEVWKAFEYKPWAACRTNEGHEINMSITV